MHMADALINPTVAAVMYAASAAAAAYSIKKVREENNPRKIPLMGVMGAFVFAAQMLNFTIPGTGSSGHWYFDNSMPFICRRRSAGFGRQYLEHGLLRLLCRRAFNLAAAYPTQA